MYYFNVVFTMLNFFVLLILVLISVAFFTLMERKVLGYIQYRKGPNKTGFQGIIQPFSDAIKLFCKEQSFPYMSNIYLYYMSPIFSMVISLMLWISFPYLFNYSIFEYSILYFICLSSMSVYGTMMAGWSSNSNYSLLGSIRSISQSISYEVSFMMIMMIFMILIEGFSLYNFYFYQAKVWLMFIFLPISFIMLSIFLAETNRTPYDLSEGESELVSGFNVEYSSGGFALIFLAEYSSILFMSFIFSMLFLGGDFMNLVFYLKFIFISYIWVWIRGTLPRFRYDNLMIMSWTSYLPLVLNFLMMSMNLFMYFLVFNL
nr:NADH dehydrogenase subunit 1 [Wallacea dactyliferae]